MGCWRVGSTLRADDSLRWPDDISRIDFSYSFPPVALARLLRAGETRWPRLRTLRLHDWQAGKLPQVHFCLLLASFLLLLNLFLQLYVKLFLTLEDLFFVVENALDLVDEGSDVPGRIRVERERTIGQVYLKGVVEPGRAHVHLFGVWRLSTSVYRLLGI